MTEVELELKAGEGAALYDFAARLTDALPVCLEIMSKAERGFMLAADDHPMPVRAEALKFPTDATLDQAVEIVINDALGQFVANWPALTETHDRESIHQMRVALRRLRTRALKRGRRLSQKPPEERHEVRVALKNIRYAAEFFHFFFSGARANEKR